MHANATKIHVCACIHTDTRTYTQDYKPIHKHQEGNPKEQSKLLLLPFDAGELKHP